MTPDPAPHLRNPFRFGWPKVVLACLLLFSIPALGAEVVKIGVLAFRPKPETLAQWQPLAVALKQALPNHDFVVEALTFPELNEAVAQHRVDFVLTNPGHYVRLAQGGGVMAPLATLALREAGQRTSFFGGVIFTRAGQTAIATLKDLRGRTIASPSPESFGGYQVEAFELSQIGIPLPQDARLIFTGMPHDTVVEAVLSGRADVGFVRSGLLEGMARDGKLDLQQIKVINRQNPANFPVQVSTRLYPDWAFSSLPQVDESLARQVAAALLLVEDNSAATTAMGIQGFSVPANYGSVEALLRALRLPPFDAAPPFTLKDVWARYRWQISGALLIAGLFTWLLVRLQMNNRKLAAAHRLELLHQQQLQEREEAFHTLADYAYDWELWEDPGGTIVYCSPSCERITGYIPDAFKGDPGLRERMLHPGERANWQAHHARVHSATGIGLMDGEELEFRILRPDGDIRWIGHVCHPIHDAAGHYRGHCITNRDITERKQAEATLREQETLLQQVLDAMSTPVFCKDREGRYTLFNRTFLAFLGRDNDQVQGKKVFDVAPLELAERYHQADLALMEQGGTQAYEHNVAAANGEHRDVIFTKDLLRNVEGKVTGLVGSILDITERKQAEKALREVHELLSLLFRQSPIYVYIKEVTSAGSRVLQASDNFQQMIGIPSSAMVGKTMEELYPIELAMKMNTDDWAVVSTGEALKFEEAFNGRSYTTIKFPIIQGDKTLLAGFTIDITERKQAEMERRVILEQAAQVQKLEALGTLVGGVAHNINNALMVIMGAISLREEQATEIKDLEAYALIGKACRRGRDVVKALIQFAQPVVSKQAPCDLHALIKGLHVLLASTTGNRVTIIEALAEEPLWVEGDAGSLSNALMNLSRNALDAMPNGGTLTFRTTALEKDWTEVSVEDNGEGMAPEFLTQAIDPFFTTKEVGKGVGLGLSMAHGVIKAHGGTLEISSLVGQGTTVKLRLPRIPAPAQEEALEFASPTPRALTVLLVDDDEDVRFLTTRMLKNAGHQIKTVPGGAEALESLSSGAFPDLIILDQNMPRMNGVQTMEKIRALPLDVPILISSGQPDIENWDCFKRPNVAVISKPFEMDELLAKLIKMSKQL